jgi:molybdate transport system ATP-binding protein
VEVTTVSAESAKQSDIEVRIRKRFRHAENDFQLNVDLRAQAGFIILFGPTGAGKTTLLDCIAGLTDPDEGMISVGGSVLFNSGDSVEGSKAARSVHNVPAWQRGIGYVLQDLALFPHLTAEENVSYGLRGTSAALKRARSREMLSAFRIDHLRERRPSQISGGERQRVALARALVIEPRALLLDEPLTALDRPTKSLIVSDLRRWNQQYRIPILFVTHSGEEVFALAEEVVILKAGRVVAHGLPKDVMHAPRLETVAQLSGFENIFDAKVIALNEKRGTMTCCIGDRPVELETPLVRVEVGANLRIGIRAGDILLATENPRGLSARNIVPGKIASIEQRYEIISAAIDCGGVHFEAHLTLAAREALELTPQKEVWVVIKTHSCHLLEA